MDNIATTAAPSATAFVTPAATWVTVRDGLNRPHLEMRWSVSTAPSVPHAAPERHAA